MIIDCIYGLVDSSRAQLAFGFKIGTDVSDSLIKLDLPIISARRKLGLGTSFFNHRA